jgi:signal transduction histidine kinase
MSPHDDPGASLERRRMRMRDYLASRLRPLAVLLLAVVAISAPLAYLIMGTQTVRARALSSAEHLADAVRGEAQQRPLLWRYDASKLNRHVRAQLAHSSVIRIDLADAHGHRIDLGLPEPGASTEDLLWASHAVTIDDVEVARAWVGSTTREVETQSLLLLLGFVVLGAGLAGLMYWIPLRAIAAADEQIGGLITRLETSQNELAKLNENLEEQVVERSQQLSDALAEVRDKERNLRTLSSRATSLQEAERRALSRELHDSAGQALTAIRINLQLLGDQAPADSPARKIAEKTVDIADGTVDEIRRVVDRLAPAILTDVGLRGALERQCDDLSERTGIVVDRSFEGLPADMTVELDSGVETVAYRVVQEAMTNISRHARATHVEVRLRKTEDALEILVHDDGRGFDLEAARAKGRRGLEGMRERVELIGGTLGAKSSRGSGTRIEVTLPLGAD